MRLLLIQSKFSIQIKRLQANEMKITIGKWEEIESFIDIILHDAQADPTIDIIEVDKENKYILFRFDEDFYVKQSGWRRLLSKYEEEIYTYMQ